MFFFFLSYNLGGAFEVSTLPGWSSRCVSAEVAWLNVGQDGRLYGLNPFIGFTGHLHGVSDYTHRSLMDSIQQNTIFTNCAITKERDVWWEGMTKDAPAGIISFFYFIYFPHLFFIFFYSIPSFPLEFSSLVHSINL